MLDVDGILAVVSRVSGHHAGYSTSLEGYGVGMGAPLTEDHEIYKGVSSCYDKSTQNYANLSKTT